MMKESHENLDYKTLISGVNGLSAAPVWDPRIFTLKEAVTK